MISGVLPVRGSSLLRAWGCRALILALLMPLVPRALDGQSWNGARALELLDRARRVRQAATVDSTLTNYRADARGFVYFFLERPGEEGRSLIKADQVALEVYWQAPNRTKQHIVGLRDEKVLPTNIQYHLDHLTVVQDDFSDRIRLGNGDEVSDVIHPVAPGAERVYDYRLGDSITISFPGTVDTVRVYELEVRPKSMEHAGFIGTVFLDRGTSAIVRMSFTFTPVSYVDAYLDYIRISLDNSLWMGRHWLPYRQEVEIRRELPVLDFLAGSVIRSLFQISAYEFNVPLEAGFFRTPYVSTLPEEQRRSFPFEEPLYAHLDREGLTTPPSLAQIRQRAGEIVQNRALSGLSRLRLHLPSASSAYRYDRAEGTFVGLGTTLRPGGLWSVRAHAGYAFSRGRASGSLTLLYEEEPSRSLELELYANRFEDVGPFRGAGGVLNSLAALVAESDWTDPYFSSGVHLVLPHAIGAVRLGLRWESHRQASDVVSGVGSSFRPVRPIEEGELVAVEIGASWGGGASPSDGWGTQFEAMQALLEGDGIRRFHVAGGWGRTGGWRNLDLLTRLNAGWVTSTRASVPPQFLYLLGGRETVLGHAFRGSVGDAFWLLRVEGATQIVDPWLSLRTFASAGQAELLEGAPPAGWDDLAPSAGPIFSVGAGVGLFWDVLRIDVGRGLGGGGWDAALSVTRRFRAWL